MTHDPVSIYQGRAAAAAAERDAFEGRWNRVANVRLGLVLVALAALALGLWQSRTWLLWLAGGVALAFVVAVVYHAQLGRLRRRAHERWAISDEGLRRLRRDWATLPLRQPPTPTSNPPPFARDLDLLGRASLQHLLNTAATPAGQTTLEHWLLHPADPSTIAARHGAVAELAPLIDFRDEMALAARLMEAPPDDARLIAWAETPPWLLERPWLIWLSRLLGLAGLSAFIAQLALGTPAAITLALAFVNGIITFALARWVEPAVGGVATGQRALQSYADLFARVAEQPLNDPLLRQIQADLAAGGGAAPQIRRLAGIVALAELRASLIGLPLQLLTLWSLHVLWLQERWQRRAGSHVRRWVTAAGDLEALAALAALRFDNPDWAFPTLQAAGSPRLEASALGHPLLPNDARVGNDVAVGPPGSFLLITGSNMSGKSTLLRSLGLNIALAQAGGPVCAAALSLPPLALATSMRVTDSLELGVSYFMAELRRLREVVTIAENPGDTGRTALFLLDELLQGTNTAERQIAARRIIRHLLDLRAIGAVSTHDLALADDPALATAVPVYLTETFSRGPDGPAMSFDYRLRPGIAPSTNALALLELVGLMGSTVATESADSGATTAR
jgi:hypothetical protein